MPKPPGHRSPQTPWPYWPLQLKTSSSHNEGCDRNWLINTKEFVTDNNGKLIALKTVNVEWKSELGKRPELIEVEDPFASQDEAGHADVDVSYFLRCEQPNEITGLKINFFDIYSNLETLQVQMVIPSGQQQLELNPQRTTLRIN